MGHDMKKWTRQELIVAFNLYCQLPFGKLHARNPLIVRVAERLERTPSALAMKMLNFASLDPTIIESGRHGLGNASNADRAVWEEFHQDWEKLALESQLFFKDNKVLRTKDLSEVKLPDYLGETKQATVEVRLKQSFFRQAVLSSYQGRCCMTGLDDPRLLIASHIVPWRQDKANRLNPSNGLCLSALHDRAFDQGLLTVMPDFTIRVSKSLYRSKTSFCELALLSLEGKRIYLPEKFSPAPELLRFHNQEIFIK
jgi:predicted restriction endonuclease